VATDARVIPASCTSGCSRLATRCRSWISPFPGPRQVAALPDRHRRPDAPLREPLLQRLGDPDGVLDVGLQPVPQGQQLAAAVPNVRPCCSRCPFPPGTRTHAAEVMTQGETSGRVAARKRGTRRGPPLSTAT